MFLAHTPINTEVCATWEFRVSLGEEPSSSFTPSSVFRGSLIQVARHKDGRSEPMSV